MGKFKDKNGKTRLRALIDHAREKGIDLPSEVLYVTEMIFPPVGLGRKTIQMVRDLVGIDPEVKTAALNELNDIALEMEKQPGTPRTWKATTGFPKPSAQYSQSLSPLITWLPNGCLSPAV
ncbi:MAG: hypothetical protein IT223_12520 [Crocinitomicaceae bacterium]|nr:hypothetical protein [Crocinitomicaceae bacterium]